MKKAKWILLLLALALAALTGCGGSRQHTAVTSLEQLDEPGRKIGVPADTADDRLAAQLFPQAKIEYFKDDIAGFTSVSQGKLDAYLYSRLTMEIAIHNGLTGVRLLDETIGEGHICAVGLSPKTSIPDLADKINAFLDEVRSDGTLDDMVGRWMERHEETMPEIPVPETSSLRLTVGTTGSSLPFTYYVGTELRGYDIELAYRFAAWLGASLEFKVYDYGGIVEAAQSGDVDCIFASLFVTPEREEALAFSQPTYIDEIGVIVRDGETAPPDGEARSIADLSHAVIGVQTGTNHDGLVLAQLPDAELRYYNSYADLLAALQDGKIDAFPATEFLLKPMMKEYPQLRLMEGSELMVGSLAFAAQKSPEGRALCEEISAWFEAFRASGEMDALLRKWNEAPDSERTVPDWTALPAERGVLHMATEGGFPPYEYYLDGNLVGIEIELAARFCEARGYGLEITDMSFESVLSSVSTGKSDFAASGLAVTEARRESLSFTEPYYTERVLLAVLDADAAASDGDFWQRAAASFEKTFLREDRWKLFVSGVGTTLLITALSIVLGTVLGFCIFLLCRKGSPAANGIARFFVWLVQGMPMVVLLMILYYVVFGSVAISGTIVAVIGFTLVFGASVFSMLKSGVGAVDIGQTEAAWTLGYSDRRAFFRIVLPQALPHFFPAYKGEITATIKATAIVGYVAVQDLTKMGDIVRSRTYDAFFPLLAVAAIYFILAAILTAIVNRIGREIDPRRRKREPLKEVRVK